MSKSTYITQISLLAFLLLSLALLPTTNLVEAAPTTNVLRGGITINELLIDPNGSNNFDTDGNGTADGLDEFVEVYNASGSAIDISGLELWDDGQGQWFTFPAGTTLGTGKYAVVVCGVQAGGSLPAVTGGNLAFDVGRGLAVINNGGDNAVLYDPTADEYIQLLYNGDAADNPPANYEGFSVTATRAGPIENWGSDTDGISLVREPAGDTNVVQHNTVSSENASPGAPSTTDEPTTGILINEVDADTAGTDTLEFIELYDGGTGNTALDGLVLVFFNGNGDVSYNALGLDGHTTDASGYFVAGNAGVAGVDLVFNDNSLQNGADAVVLYTGDATDFPNGTAVTTTDLHDALVYDTDDADDAGLLILLNGGEPQVNERGGGDGTAHSNQRCPNGSGGQRNTSSYEQNGPTPGAENDCDPDPGEFGNCGDPATLIHAIQGSGTASPEAGNVHVVEGVVVGDFQENDELKGFFLQEEDADADADPATSEGIFVYDDDLDVNPGDMVRVQGTVSEYYDLTRLGSVTNARVCPGSATITAAAVSLPIADVADWEYIEGMQVVLPQALVVSENYDLGRYGELVLSNGRLMNPTNIVSPGAPALAQQAANDLNRIILDDGSTIQNPDPIVHPAPELSALNSLRGGDTVQGLQGVLTYAYNYFRVHPIATPAFVSTNARTITPGSVGGTLKVASFNVLNYFNGDGLGGGFPTSRGADTYAEFVRQRTKIITAISGLDADVIGLMEIENDGYGSNSAIQDLVYGLNTEMGAGTYAFIDTGKIGTDAIKVAFIYKPSTVTPVGAYAILDSSVDPDFIDNKNRPVLAQTFEETATGEVFTVAVNHLKSKGSDCDSIGDPDTGDGQGNCNVTRTKAAQALADWLATDPTGSGDPDYLIIGDLNAYAMEDPVAAIKAAGYTDLVQTFVGADAYSYVYMGQAGSLDHALANASLRTQVTGVTEWHINADEPKVLDYNTEYKSPDQIVDLYNDDPYRASDHDPVVVGLELGERQKIYLPLVMTE